MCKKESHTEHQKLSADDKLVPDTWVGKPKGQARTQEEVSPTGKQHGDVIIDPSKHQDISGLDANSSKIWLQGLKRKAVGMLVVAPRGATSSDSGPQSNIIKPVLDQICTPWAADVAAAVAVCYLLVQPEVLEQTQAQKYPQRPPTRDLNTFAFSAEGGCSSFVRGLVPVHQRDVPVLGDYERAQETEEEPRYLLGQPNAQ